MPNIDITLFLGENIFEFSPVSVVGFMNEELGSVKKELGISVIFFPSLDSGFD